MKRRVSFELRVVKQRLNQHSRAWAIYNPKGIKFAARLGNTELPSQIERVAQDRAGYMMMRLGF